MVRFFAILLFFGLAVVSGAAGYFAHMKKQQEVVEPEVVADFQPMSAFDLIDDAPKEDQAIELNDFFFGRRPVGISLDDNKKDWGEAYIPLFPKANRVQHHNAVCVIYCTDELKTEAEAAELFERTELQGFYSPASQELSSYAFSELAQLYKSLDYNRCVILTTKKPEAIEEKSTYWMALFGFAFFLSIAGWQSFALLGDMKNRIEREKRAREVSDAAGLGSLFEAVDAKNGTDPAPTDTPQASFIERWKPDEE